MNDQALVRAICQQPFEGGREWRAHGIGMLRTYLDAGRLVRLNLWHHDLITPGISTMHTHPWQLRSHIVIGGLTNIRWERVMEEQAGASAWLEDQVACGAGDGQLKGEPVEVWLRPQPSEVLLPGTFYSQEPHEIHTTEFRDGTATIMARDKADSMADASVFWPKGETWGDAARDVTADEIVKVCHATLALLDG